ncbi:phage virion morphogenesis protein [Acinetobacter ursingii]|uniref:phage virion morphogenesis protein n=1 Tax=Acinetobacter ursingii TaxID=108980 RepID=UPI0021CD7B76|nr:phage virion morphogenesis protein [Acinetobacter ursingii]MCU4601868.1 phage virion morphogenesis protein [Acinetobacter ursingii]
MLKFNIRSEVIVNVLSHAEATLDNPNPMFQDMGEYQVQSTQQNFRDSKSPDGTKWQPNSESTYMSILGSLHENKDGTLNKKGINRIQSKKPLVGSGLLRDQIHYQVSGDLLLVGSNLVYAAIHQFGGTIKPKNKKTLSWKIGNVSVFAKKVVIPAREYLGISLKDETELQNIVADHILP